MNQAGAMRWNRAQQMALKESITKTAPCALIGSRLLPESEIKERRRVRHYFSVCSRHYLTLMPVLELQKALLDTVQKMQRFVEAKGEIPDGLQRDIKRRTVKPYITECVTQTLKMAKNSDLRKIPLGCLRLARF